MGRQPGRTGPAGRGLGMKTASSGWFSGRSSTSISSILGFADEVYILNISYLHVIWIHCYLLQVCAKKVRVVTVHVEGCIRTDADPRIKNGYSMFVITLSNHFVQPHVDIL